MHLARVIAVWCTLPFPMRIPDELYSAARRQRTSVAAALAGDWIGLPAQHLPFRSGGVRMGAITRLVPCRSWRERAIAARLMPDRVPYRTGQVIVEFPYNGPASKATGIGGSGRGV